MIHVGSGLWPCSMYLYKDPVTFALLYLPQRADLVVSREGFPFLFFVLAFTQTSLKVPSHTISGRFSGMLRTTAISAAAFCVIARSSSHRIASHRTLAPGEPEWPDGPDAKGFLTR